MTPPRNLTYRTIPLSPLLSTLLLLLLLTISHSVRASRHTHDHSDIDDDDDDDDDGLSTNAPHAKYSFGIRCAMSVEALKDTTVADVAIRAGTPVLLLMRHDTVSEAVFAQADAFLPERWLPEGLALPDPPSLLDALVT